jgi:hypothetical protein
MPGTPALRKYLLTTMSVASCDHDAGTSTSFMAKTVEPSGFAITVLRLVPLHIGEWVTTWSRVTASDVQSGLRGRCGAGEECSEEIVWDMKDLPGP